MLKFLLDLTLKLELHAQVSKVFLEKLQIFGVLEKVMKYAVLRIEEAKLAGEIKIVVGPSYMCCRISMNTV